MEIVMATSERVRRRWHKPSTEDLKRSLFLSLKARQSRPVGLGLVGYQPEIGVDGMARN